MGHKFEGKVVLVTGASRGIGRETALAFAREGASLIIAARSPQPLEETATAVRETGAVALAVPTDVASEPAVEALIAAALTRFGRIDIVVNNAGIGRVGTVEGGDYAADVRDTLQASLFGMIHVTRHVLPIFRREGTGTFANVSSVMGRKAFAGLRRG
jgi:NAD(P)-dependent dehydrogenase (short-subunit alcohol dehydrogenase family)